MDSFSLNSSYFLAKGVPVLGAVFNLGDARQGVRLFFFSIAQIGSCRPSLTASPFGICQGDHRFLLLGQVRREHRGLVWNVACLHGPFFLLLWHRTSVQLRQGGRRERFYGIVPKLPELDGLRHLEPHWPS